MLVSDGLDRNSHGYTTTTCPCGSEEPSEMLVDKRCAKHSEEITTPVFGSSSGGNLRAKKAVLEKARDTPYSWPQ